MEDVKEINKNNNINKIKKFPISAQKGKKVLQNLIKVGKVLYQVLYKEYKNEILPKKWS